MTTRQARHPAWDESDLVRRLCHALDIASLAVEHLAPAGYRDAEKPAANVRREKPIAETGLLLHGAVLAIHHPEVAAGIRRVASQLAPHARGAQIRVGLALNPALAFDYALAHILLTRLGLPDPGFDALLRQCRAAQAHAGRERVPHRVLEQEWIDSLWNPAANGRPRALDRTARFSILNQPMDLFASNSDDLYAFTHAVMFATGFQRTPGALPRSRSVVLAEAEAALARCLDAQDYDLAGELLLAWPLTGTSWSSTAAFAFRVLAEVEDKAGFLPTAATRIEELKAREGSDRTQYLLATAYHTAYVMGLLCAAALQPGCAPPVRIPARGAAKGRAGRILPLLEDGKTAPHWRGIFDKLEPLEADALAPLLFDIALQRRVAKRDFAGLAQVLRLGYDLGLAATPAASQAAEILERIALCAAVPEPTSQSAA